MALLPLQPDEGLLRGQGEQKELFTSDDAHTARGRNPAATRASHPTPPRGRRHLGVPAVEADQHLLDGLLVVVVPRRPGRLGAPGLAELKMKGDARGCARGINAHRAERGAAESSAALAPMRKAEPEKGPAAHNGAQWLARAADFRADVPAETVEVVVVEVDDRRRKPALLEDFDHHLTMRWEQAGTEHGKWWSLNSVRCAQGLRCRNAMSASSVLSFHSKRRAALPREPRSASRWRRPSSPCPGPGS